MSSYKGFTQVELRKPERSTFDLSHERRTSGRIGKLIPILIRETLPNDTFYGSTEVLLKVAPLLAPIYHRLNLFVHYFFVSQRIIWDSWEDFITGGRVGAEISNPPIPPNFSVAEAYARDANYLMPGGLLDHLGVSLLDYTTIPGSDWGPVTLDARPCWAYQRVWYDYYRDRNFVADTVMDFPQADGTIVDTAQNFEALLTLRSRAWQHDYFTSALPWTQRGAEVLMPMEGSATMMYSSITGNPVPAGKYIGTDPLIPGRLGSGNSFNPATSFGSGEIVFENQEISINDARRAFALQSWMERNALAGTRYNESIYAHFNRRTSDARLQRAEYLGGGKAVVQISEVLTTAYSEDAGAEVVPPGNMSGRGSTFANTNAFKYNTEEHGFIIGILSVMPTSAYMQGIDRMFVSRKTQLDYPFPSFAHLGEQEVYDYELWGSPGTLGYDGFFENPLQVFGYQSRYADWKHCHSSSHGDFKTSLDFWHMSRKFAGTGSLNEQFVTFEDDLQDRVFAVADSDTLWMYVYNDLKVKRCLPYFGTPKLVG